MCPRPCDAVQNVRQGRGATPSECLCAAHKHVLPCSSSAAVTRRGRARLGQGEEGRKPHRCDLAGDEGLNGVPNFSFCNVRQARVKSQDKSLRAE